MNILLVESGPGISSSLAFELEARGHTVRAADSVGGALAAYVARNADVVVTDIHLSDGDGFGLADEIQKLAAPRWQPIFFLADERDDELQAKAFRAGVDGYVFRPIAIELLEAKFALIQKVLSAQRLAEARAAELERHYADEEADKRVAQHLIHRLVSAEKLDDPAVRHWITPATTFSGDVVAVARTPGNQMHVLLADGAGHGLSASLNVLPIIAPFYRMTEKGFGIDAISREMNAKIRQLLPKDRLVAATLIAIDFRDGYVRVWNGGNPPPMLLGRDGQIDYVFSTKHLALGMLDDGEFEPQTETRVLGPDAQLFVYSDGLINAENAAGGVFGYERLVDTLRRTSTADRIDRLRDAVLEHLDNAAARDDIAVLAVTCVGEDGVPRESLPVAALPQRNVEANWKLTLRLGAEELRQLDVVPMLLDLVNRFEGARRRTGELFVILSELFNNALDHGLLRLDSRLKLGSEGMETYFSERAERLAKLENGTIEIELEEFFHAGRSWMRVSMRDSGAGFDHGTALREGVLSDELPFGRGLSLIRSMVSSFEYNDAGNVAQVVIGLTDAAAVDHGLV